MFSDNENLKATLRKKPYDGFDDIGHRLEHELDTFVFMPMSSSTRAAMKYRLTECLECMINERVIEAYNVSETFSANSHDQFGFIVMVKKPYELKFERIQLMCHN